MNPVRFELSDSDRAKLVGIVTIIDRELNCLALAGTVQDHLDAKRDLAASWARLVELLDLGPPPEVRACPVCEHACRRAATLCGHCWNRLVPNPPAGNAERAAKLPVPLPQ